MAVSADGRFVAFNSFATDLVAGAAKGVDQVYVRDRKLGTTEQASVSSRGQQGDGDAGRGLAISPGGRFVAFSSYATDLVPGDTNRGRCSDRLRARRLRARPEDGHDRAGQPVLARREGDGDSGLYGVAISANGRFVAFDSDATNLVPGGTDGRPQIFVRDRKLGTRIARSSRRPEPRRGMNDQYLSLTTSSTPCSIQLRVHVLRVDAEPLGERVAARLELLAHPVHRRERVLRARCGRRWPTARPGRWRPPRPAAATSRTGWAGSGRRRRASAGAHSRTSTRMSSSEIGCAQPGSGGRLAVRACERCASSAISAGSAP